jgi:hypothetical protein
MKKIKSTKATLERKKKKKKFIKKGKKTCREIL